MRGAGRWARAALGAGLALCLHGPAGAQSATERLSRPAPRPSADAAALAGPGVRGDDALSLVGPAPVRLPQASGGGTPDQLAQAVLTVDQEAMYRQSAWGLRAERQIAQQSRQVAADNDTAFAALVADEDALTAARATLGAEEFRKRAAAFDERVTAVRQERDAARAALTHTAELDRALFFQAAAPVLSRVMEARGARVVLDQRTVLISDEGIDVTAATIAALDSALGDGAAIVAAAARKKAEDAKAAGAAGQAGPAAQGAPVQGAPVQGASVQGMAVQGAAGQGTAAQGAPVQGAPVQGAPVQGAAEQGAAGQAANTERAVPPAPGGDQGHVAAATSATAQPAASAPAAPDAPAGAATLPFAAAPRPSPASTPSSAPATMAPAPSASGAAP